ncbi:lipopolysaccharide transport periplasmic protein LptA [Variovorax sp. VNK109]|jgi:lipopolysaccharide export system protein LptA|uniref:lipopolysaccharide transport periplasmic protein LptA n=1 Tax=Variovorax sp. VNK109 TaxID=3400919 RepID=UPI003C07F7A2
MKNTLIPSLIAAFALIWGTAHAEKADRDKPMNIEADSLRYDDLKQTSVFTGNVVLTKGTIIIRGARVEVRQDPEGYQYGVVTAEPGKLAYYRQKRDNLDEYIEGESEVIEYNSKADNVKFIRRAELRRYRGATMNDEMTGNIITYDNGGDVFTINGVPAQQGTAPAPGGRVRAMLTPRSAASDPGATAPATPAGPGSAPLRPSTTLGGEKK